MHRDYCTTVLRIGKGIGRLVSMETTGCVKGRSTKGKGIREWNPFYASHLELTSPPQWHDWAHLTLLHMLLKLIIIKEDIIDVLFFLCLTIHLFIHISFHFPPYIILLVRCFDNSWDNIKWNSGTFTKRQQNEAKTEVPVPQKAPWGWLQNWVNLYRSLFKNVQI